MAFVYLDHAATTPLDPRVREAMLPWLGERFGNPSSRHKPGVAAAQAIEAARASVARAIGARRDEVVFTSGGTEANALAVLGGARARREKGRHVLVGPTEHACVRESALALAREGFEVETLRLDARGALDLEHAAGRMRADTVLVAQMLVQNEVGTIYPVRELARAVRARSKHALVHVDAVQALGKLELDVEALGCDTLALSAHKAHGPQGAGALFVRANTAIDPLVHGGGQERGLRSGTPNVAAIVGFGAASQFAEDERPEHERALRALRAELVAGLARFPSIRLFDRGATAPHIAALLVPGVPSEVRMHHLEERGVVVSAGSACQAQKAAISPSLLALGLTPDEARTMLRLSFSHTTTAMDVEAFLAALHAVESRLASAKT